MSALDALDPCRKDGSVRFRHYVSGSVVFSVVILKDKRLPEGLWAVLAT